MSIIEPFIAILFAFFSGGAFFSSESIPKKTESFARIVSYLPGICYVAIVALTGTLALGYLIIHGVATLVFYQGFKREYIKL